MKNNYLYQGAYAELDEDIGWTDFALRNYDAQIGRWVQQDPYQEFASPYVGMGNDPVNLIDPSGGSVDPIYKTLETVVVSASRTAATVAPKVVSNIAAKIITTTLMKAVSVINTSVNTKQVGDRVLIYARGVSDAIFNANVLNTHDAIWGTNLGDYDDPYDKEAYLKGRIAGDGVVLVQAAAQVNAGLGGGGGLALVTGGTSVVVGAGVAAHGTVAAGVATADIAWANKKLAELSISKVGTGGLDIGNSFKQVNTSTEKNSSGETTYTKEGRDVHNNYNPGNNYTTKRTDNRLNNGKIPDAIDVKNKVVKELKPNNPRAIKAGWKQVKEYARQLEKQYGGKWKTVVDTYERNANGTIKYNYRKP